MLIRLPRLLSNPAVPSKLTRSIAKSKHRTFCSGGKLYVHSFFVVYKTKRISFLSFFLLCLQKHQQRTLRMSSVPVKQKPNERSSCKWHRKSHTKMFINIAPNSVRYRMHISTQCQKT